MVSAPFTAKGKIGTPRLKSPGTPKSDCNSILVRKRGVSEGRMARLDPYLGQSLKEIIPNADVVLAFVSVSHGSMLQYYG